MPNTYLGVYCRLKNLPVLFKDSKTILPGNKISYFAKETKEYDISGEYLTTPYKDAPQVKLVEEYFNKIKGFNWFSEKPFFKKVSETKPVIKGNIVEITKTNTKGSSSLTSYNINGIRTNKITQKLNPKTEQYEYSRLVYNDKGTNPQVVSKWEGEYCPLNEISR